MVEFDVRKTIDGKLVLYHDRFMRYIGEYHKIGKNSLISHTSLERLNKTYSKNGFPVLTLEDMIKHYADRIDFNIELKVGGYEKEVVDLIRKYDIQHRVIISAFDSLILSRIKSIDGSIRAGWLIGQNWIYFGDNLRRMITSLVFKVIKADTVHIHYKLINPRIIKLFHELDVPVYTWTVNDIEHMKKLIDLGIDGIMTNKPGVLYALVNNLPVMDETELVLNAQSKYQGGGFETRQGGN